MEELNAITEKLSTDFPNISFDKVNADSAEGYADAMVRACEAEAELQRKQQAKDSYTEALQEEERLTKELEKAQAEYNAELEAKGYYWNENAKRYQNAWAVAAESPLADWTTDLDVYRKKIDELEASQSENNARMEEIRQGWEAETKAVEEAITANDDYELAAASAYSSVQSEIEKLCAAYDEVYKSALESFEGQFGLFDKAQAYANATVANAQIALDAQLSYWQSYNSNIEMLSSYGATLTGEARTNFEALMTYVQSGSEEAAGLAQSMANAINSGNAEAVTNVAKTISAVRAEQEKASAQIAEWTTGFSTEMDKIEKRMGEAVENMGMSDEAENAAKKTIDAYIAGIKSGENGAVAAARSVATQVSAALAGNSIPVARTSVYQVRGRANGTTNAENLFLAGEEGPELIMRRADAYANGTTDSARAFIAGENGPELIVGQQGSTVFPTRETDRLIDALSDRRKEPIWSVPNSGDEREKSGYAEQCH